MYVRQTADVALDLKTFREFKDFFCSIIYCLKTRCIWEHTHRGILLCLNMARTGESERQCCGRALGLTSADREMCSAVERNRMSAGKHTQRVAAVQG